MISRALTLAALAALLASAPGSAQEPPGAPLEEPIPPAADVAPDDEDASDAGFPEAPPGSGASPLGDDEPGEAPPPIPGSDDARQEESEYGT